MRSFLGGGSSSNSGSNSSIATGDTGPRESPRPTARRPKPTTSALRNNGNKKEKEVYTFQQQPQGLTATEQLLNRLEGPEQKVSLNRKLQQPRITVTPVEEMWENNSVVSLEVTSYNGDARDEVETIHSRRRGPPVVQAIADYDDYSIQSYDQSISSLPASFSTQQRTAFRPFSRFTRQDDASIQSGSTFSGSRSLHDRVQMQRREVERKFQQVRQISQKPPRSRPSLKAAHEHLRHPIPIKAEEPRMYAIYDTNDAPSTGMSRQPSQSSSTQSYTYLGVNRLSPAEETAVSGLTKETEVRADENTQAGSDDSEDIVVLDKPTVEGGLQSQVEATNDADEEEVWKNAKASGANLVLENGEVLRLRVEHDSHPNNHVEFCGIEVSFDKFCENIENKTTCVHRSIKTCGNVTRGTAQQVARRAKSCAQETFHPEGDSVPHVASDYSGGLNQYDVSNDPAGLKTCGRPGRRGLWPFSGHRKSDGASKASCTEFITNPPLNAEDFDCHNSPNARVGNKNVALSADIARKASSPSNKSSKIESPEPKAASPTSKSSKTENPETEQASSDSKMSESEGKLQAKAKRTAPSPVLKTKPSTPPMPRSSETPRSQRDRATSDDSSINQMKRVLKEIPRDLVEAKRGVIEEMILTGIVVGVSQSVDASSMGGTYDDGAATVVVDGDMPMDPIAEETAEDVAHETHLETIQGGSLTVPDLHDRYNALGRSYSVDANAQIDRDLIVTATESMDESIEIARSYDLSENLRVKKSEKKGKNKLLSFLRKKQVEAPPPSTSGRPPLYFEARNHEGVMERHRLAPKPSREEPIVKGRDEAEILPIGSPLSPDSSPPARSSLVVPGQHTEEQLSPNVVQPKEDMVVPESSPMDFEQASVYIDSAQSVNSAISAASGLTDGSSPPIVVVDEDDDDDIYDQEVESINSGVTELSVATRIILRIAEKLGIDEDELSLRLKSGEDVESMLIAKLEAAGIGVRDL